MKRRYRRATPLFAAVLAVVAALAGATTAAGEGGGQNQFPCTSTTIRAPWPRDSRPVQPRSSGAPATTSSSYSPAGRGRARGWGRKV